METVLLCPRERERKVKKKRDTEAFIMIFGFASCLRVSYLKKYVHDSYECTLTRMILNVYDTKCKNYSSLSYLIYFLYMRLLLQIQCIRNNTTSTIIIIFCFFLRHVIICFPPAAFFH